ncbi:hypothetical protein [Pseudonocardia dioxanivorans]|nr:hypothetical protein [Pseudonocardia dioxanivorans]
MAILKNLSEPNETHLGLSKGRSQGNAVGDKLAEKFWEELSGSRAAQSGLITDLEDTALLIENVREDRISDVTTCLIRTQLIEYTQAACEYYGIPTRAGSYAGSEWEPLRGQWIDRSHDLPIAAGIPLLLVPKEIVRRKLHLDPGEYYRHHVLNFLWREELARVSSLAITARGRRRPAISKGAVEDKYRGMFDSGRTNPGVEKRINTWYSERNPEALSDFKEQKSANPARPMTNEEISETSGASIDELQEHLDLVLSTPTGKPAADLYHRRVEALLSALFYPDMIHPRREVKINDGRKRIDITYTNAARSGFFHWLAMNYPAANIVVECKNYSKPIGNPEYDQLLGRFSPSRGKVGLLLFRGYVDKANVRASCRDAANNSQGWILALDDADLKALVEEAVNPPTGSFGHLHRLFNELLGFNS